MGGDFCSDSERGERMNGKLLEGKKILMVISPIQFRDEEFSVPKEAFEEEGAEVLFSTYRDGANYLQQEIFPFVKSPSIGFRVKPDGTVDFKQTAANPGPFIASFSLAKQIEAEIKFMKAFEPDVVVSDSRISSIFAAEMLKIPDICILNQFFKFVINLNR